MSHSFSRRNYCTVTKKSYDARMQILSSVAINGIRATEVQVEVDVSPGMGQFSIVGLGDTAVQESRERVRSAIKNS